MKHLTTIMDGPCLAGGPCPLARTSNAARRRNVALQPVAFRYNADAGTDTVPSSTERDDQARSRRPSKLMQPSDKLRARQRHTKSIMCQQTREWLLLGSCSPASRQENSSCPRCASQPRNQIVVLYLRLSGSGQPCANKRVADPIVVCQ